MNLLLLSNSSNPDSGYLEHARPWLVDLLRGVTTLAFVPYAAVRFGYDQYEASVAAALDGLVEVRSVHHSDDPAQTVEACDAVAVGGGNTFRLLECMHRYGLVEAIRTAVLKGKPYAGWSAGSNVASPTIRTTNDMPVVEPPTFGALDLIPFQINPHYLDAHPDKHMGETREERLEEFVVLNPGMLVVGVREGSALRLTQAEGMEDRTLELLGPRTARIFGMAGVPREVEPGSDLGFLLS